MSMTPSGPEPADVRNLVTSYAQYKLRNVVLVAGITAVFGVCALFWFGIREAMKEPIGEDVAQQLSLEQLAGDGPRDNEHIELTGFSGAKEFVFEARASAIDRPTWDTVWLALIPKGGAYDQLLANSAADADTPEPSFRVLLKSREVRNEAGLSRLLARRSLRGLVVNRVAPLTAREKELVGSVYPNADLSHVWVFEQGRLPVKRGSLLGLWVGLLILIVGAVCALWMFVSERRRGNRLAVASARVERLQKRYDPS